MKRLQYRVVSWGTLSTTPYVRKVQKPGKFMIIETVHPIRKGGHRPFEDLLEGLSYVYGRGLRLNEVSVTLNSKSGELRCPEMFLVPSLHRSIGTRVNVKTF